MKYDTKDIQKCILSIIKDVNQFCLDNNINYYLMGGSALGAMRHSGFIPWDDDLDIFMTYNDYHKFIELFQNNNQKKYKKYFLQVENTNEWPLFITRVCLKNTTMISNEFKNNILQHHNVFIDIMCLYSAPDNKFQHRIQYISAQLLRINALAKCGFKSKSKMKNIVLNLSKIIVNPLTKRYLMHNVSKYENKKTSIVGHYFGRARYKNTSFKREYIGTTRYVDFEDTKLPVFEFVEEYLNNRFGMNWKEIPNMKIRNKYPVHGNYIDLKNDYTKYLENNKWKI